MSSPAHSSSSSSVSSEPLPDAPQPAPAAVVQQVNIRLHVPVLLDLSSANYGQWCVLFESVLGKFGLDDFVRSAPPIAQRTAEWQQIDHTVVNWIYTTINKTVFDIIYRPRVSAFTLWGDVEGLFLDNELHRAVYLEAELRSIVQGDATIDKYCSTLKRLAHKLRDIGQPVSEPSQVLNLLRGLNPKYRHVKPVITSKRPPHTFQSARSFLALEELQMQHDDKMEAGQALLASHDRQTLTVPPAPSSGSASGSRSRPKSKGKSKQKSSGGGSSGTS
ncbi:uncharacterized protein LOC120659136 [Panicum virgatum]|uniref:uncharacterized protein LOC120659136 n=1 Tax=Panicum virgatum TaxID=38727 RepID=UPI0019D622DF|nr:uncharacterized protein LOC120659136 [Panicum virgatum]